MNIEPSGLDGPCPCHALVETSFGPRLGLGSPAKAKTGDQAGGRNQASVYRVKTGVHWTWSPRMADSGAVANAGAVAEAGAVADAGPLHERHQALERRKTCAQSRPSAAVVPGVKLPDADHRASALSTPVPASVGVLSLEQLMDAYVTGSSTAFDELYTQLSPKVFGYLLRLTQNRHRAEDLLQVTFAKLHRGRASYLSGAPLTPWVLAIARRAFLDEVRAQNSRREQLTSDGRLPEIHTQAPPGAGRNELLEWALEQLPANHREAITLTKLLGLSMVEAGSVLGTTPTAVKLRVHRGYQALRQLLQEHGEV